MNWVQRRAACNLRSVFDDLIESVRHDAVTASLVGERGTFTVESVNHPLGPTLKVRRDRDGLHVLFTRDEGSIRVRYNDERRQSCLLEVSPKWNSATLSCDLLLNGGRAVSFDYIKETALGPLFFELP